MKIFSNILPVAIAVLFLLMASCAVSGQPPCNIRYFVISPPSSDTGDIVPGPLVPAGYYTVWYAVESSPLWKTYGPVLLEGGHNYAIAIGAADPQIAISRDTSRLAPYSKPDANSVGIYYANADWANNVAYKITVCP
ncbi:MAG: hypothetical protein MUO26_09245 [Methanotrichaceae archaeon]|nr:hypothetical protein [Methanotrichaceae archaeon]